MEKLIPQTDREFMIVLSERMGTLSDAIEQFSDTIKHLQDIRLTSIDVNIQTNKDNLNGRMNLIENELVIIKNLQIEARMKIIEEFCIEIKGLNKFWKVAVSILVAVSLIFGIYKFFSGK